MIRKFKGAIHSRTMWVSLAIMVLGAIQDNSNYLQPLLDEKTFGMVMIVVGIVVAILRMDTHKSLEDR